MSSRFSAAHAIAVQIASRCQMDIMSLAYQPLGTEEDPDCITTVVYVNNGRSLDDIRRIMEPEMDNYPRVYWMIQDLSVWQGTLECIVTTRGTKEEWRQNLIKTAPEVTTGRYLASLRRAENRKADELAALYGIA